MNIPPYQLGKKWPNRKRPEKGLKRVPPSIEKRLQISRTLKGKYKGEKCPAWKGGKTPENIKVRGSAEYKYWRREVFKRDNFTCQKHGINGRYLMAHHINNFADFPELRFDINNGITLSREAHNLFHRIYGKTNNTKEQLNQFLKKDGNL
jgi:hypothetical protein